MYKIMTKEVSDAVYDMVNTHAEKFFRNYGASDFSGYATAAAKKYHVIGEVYDYLEEKTLMPDGTCDPVLALDIVKKMRSDLDAELDP